jgi:hypothetical protein
MRAGKRTRLPSSVGQVAESRRGFTSSVTHPATDGVGGGDALDGVTGTSAVVGAGTVPGVPVEASGDGPPGDSTTTSLLEAPRDSHPCPATAATAVTAARARVCNVRRRRACMVFGCGTAAYAAP